MALKMSAQVHGVRELQRGIGRAIGQQVPKEIGKVNKQVGAYVISKVRPRPIPTTVGAGAGAAIRPSATAREVILRAGGAHRGSERTVQTPQGSRKVQDLRQWGRTPVDLFRNKPLRPNIIGTAEDEADTIMTMLRDGYLRALKPPFR